MVALRRRESLVENSSPQIGRQMILGHRFLIIFRHSELAAQEKVFWS